jgi:hypothetical protein
MVAIIPEENNPPRGIDRLTIYDTDDHTPIRTARQAASHAKIEPFWLIIPREGEAPAEPPKW